MPTVTVDGAGVNTANPSTTCARTTGIAVADQESYFAVLRISNDNPTFSVATFAGHNMTEVLRMAKTGTGSVVLFGYKNATGSSIASGATCTFTWTNTGTTNGGGSEVTGAKCDSVVDPTVADTTGTAQNTSTTPSATSGTPSSSSKDYLSVSGLGGLLSISATGQATPPAGYTAFTEGYNSTRTRTIYAAAKVLTQPVSAETVAWSQTWGASRQWAEIVALFELAASGTNYNDTAAGTLTLTGSVVETHTHTSSATGTLTLTGSKTDSFLHTATATGTIAFTGATAETHAHTGSATGALLFTGSSSESNSAVPADTGWAFANVLQMLRLKRRAP